MSVLTKWCICPRTGLGTVREDGIRRIDSDHTERFSYGYCAGCRGLVWGHTTVRMAKPTDPRVGSKIYYRNELTPI